MSSLTRAPVGAAHGGRVLALRRLVPRTLHPGTLWPTPTAGQNGKTPEAYVRMKARMGKGTKITELRPAVHAVERGLCLAPPHPDALRPAAALLGATPAPRSQPAELNPAWVEWLMGFPLGWTGA